MLQVPPSGRVHENVRAASGKGTLRGTPRGTSTPCPQGSLCSKPVKEGEADEHPGGVIQAGGQLSAAPMGPLKGGHVGHKVTHSVC